MELQGRTWDLIQKERGPGFSKFARASQCITLPTSGLSTRIGVFFEVDFRPDGARETYTFKLKHQLYRSNEQ